MWVVHFLHVYSPAVLASPASCHIFYTVHVVLCDSCVICDSGGVRRCGLVRRSVPWQVFRSCEATRIFWMSSRLLYYCFIHRAWSNYFNSPLRWGADWQLPSSEWSVRFSDSAEDIWCILTIIGATATTMFSKPLCYFPGGCPQGIFFFFLQSSCSAYKDAFRRQDRWVDCCPLQITHTTA